MKFTNKIALLSMLMFANGLVMASQEENITEKQDTSKQENTNDTKPKRTWSEYCAAYTPGFVTTSATAVSDFGAARWNNVKDAASASKDGIATSFENTQDCFFGSRSQAAGTTLGLGLVGYANRNLLMTKGTSALSFAKAQGLFSNKSLNRMGLGVLGLVAAKYAYDNSFASRSYDFVKSSFTSAGTKVNGLFASKKVSTENNSTEVTDSAK